MSKGKKYSTSDSDALLILGLVVMYKPPPPKKNTTFIFTYFTCTQPSVRPR